MLFVLQNDSFARDCSRQSTDHAPLWRMRQRGRYLAEYRQTREKAGSFKGLATYKDFATELTLQAVDRYRLDAPILFAGILAEPRKALQGHVDLHQLFAPPVQVAQDFRRVLDSFGKPHTAPLARGRHVFSIWAKASINTRHPSL